MTKLFIRSQFNYNTMDASDEAALRCEDLSLTQQNQKEEADINTIIRRFGLTGHLPENPRMPSYGDYTGIGTYQEALNAVKQADAAFMALPAEMRYRFENNPENLLQFIADDNNREEAERLGLVPKKEAPTGVGPEAGRKDEPKAL